VIYHDAKDPRRGQDPNNLDDLGLTVAKATAFLKPVRGEFDSIVVTGMSGVIVGAPVALRLRKPLVVLRKEGDDAHGAYRGWINQDRLGERALFLDDFTYMGFTRNRVIERVEQQGAKVVATYLYRDDEYEQVAS
jgi:adenine/guanine phosphoribosyltransferase-like PRPP-binding protein